MARKQQLQRPVALLKRNSGKEAAVAASGCVAGRFNLFKLIGVERGRNGNTSMLQRPGNSSSSVEERCWSVSVARKQQLQRPVALLQRCSEQQVSVAASGSVAGRSNLLKLIGVERGQNGNINPQKQQLQRPGALLER